MVRSCGFRRPQLSITGSDRSRMVCGRELVRAKRQSPASIPNLDSGEQALTE